MPPAFVTEGVSSYCKGVQPGDTAYYRTAMVRGNLWLRKAGVETVSPDLRFLSYLVFRGMSDLVHNHQSLDDDYIVAGDVLDRWVTDHDAELLYEIIPEVRREAEGEIGSMSNEVAAVHAVLLHVAGAIRESWEGGV